MFDLIALAYHADLTRVVSYMMVSEGTNRTYNHIGVSDAFHPVSHHANDLGRIEKLVKIQTWHMDRFADFLGKMAEIRDGEGTLLDNSIFMYGSNMCNSDRHNGHPLPTIIVGGGGGKLSGGKHIELPGPTPLANLHLTILEQGRCGAEKFRRQHRDNRGCLRASLRMRLSANQDGVRVPGSPLQQDMHHPSWPGCSVQIILAPLPGCDKESGDKTPGIASLNPGLLSKQPSGLRFARRRRAGM